MKCAFCSNRINKKKEFYVVSGKRKYCRYCFLYAFRFVTDVVEFLRKEN